MLLLASLLACVLAFDSGHHHDLIRNALSLKGYDGLGILIAQERSWLVEYFALYTNLNQTTANAGSLCALALARAGALGRRSISFPRVRRCAGAPVAPVALSRFFASR